MMEMIPKLFVERQSRFRKIVVDNMIIDFVCWLLRVNYGTLVMSSQQTEGLSILVKGLMVTALVSDDQMFKEAVCCELHTCKNKKWFTACFTRFSTLSKALPRFEIFEIYRARVEDNKIQRSDNPIIHHFAGCRIRSLKIICAEQKDLNFIILQVHASCIISIRTGSDGSSLGLDTWPSSANQKPELS